MAVTHYLEALDLQKEWVKVHTIFGGKNPHPNYLVGGVPCAINIDGNGAAGAPINVVNPDAVIRGSRIWDGKWKQERAQSNKIEADDVEKFYRDRSMLKLSVLPEDIAEAVYFLASDKAGKSTGNILNVDAGNAAAFTR